MAARAAVSTWTRAKCQKSPGYGTTGSKLPSTRARSDAERSPAPKMSASSRWLAWAISSGVGQPFGFLDQDLQADRPGQAELRLELAEQHVDPPHVAGGPHLGHDQHVERVPCARDDLDDVAVAPGRVDAVDPHGPHGPSPVQPGERPDRDGPGRLLRRRRAGVLEVEEHQVRPGRRRLLAHALAARRRRQLRTSGSWCAHDASFVRGLRWCRPPATRRGARRRGRGGHRRRRRCPRRAPVPGGRSRPASRSGCATGAWTVMVPRSGSSTSTKEPRARRCSSASSCSRVVDGCRRHLGPLEHAP